jgi:hypothetical protein
VGDGDERIGVIGGVHGRKGGIEGGRWWWWWWWFGDKEQKKRDVEVL